MMLTEDAGRQDEGAFRRHANTIFRNQTATLKARIVQAS
jgi:hypothetical protein